MGTTAAGLPYPDPTAPVAEFDLQLKAALQAFESEVLNYRCRVYRTAVQAIASGVQAAISWDAETTDAKNLHNTGLNPTRVTVGKAGRYQVLAQCAFTNNATGYRELQVHKNGVAVSTLRLAPFATPANYYQIVASVLCAAGDYLELKVTQNSGAALNTSLGDDGMWMDVSYVGTL